MAKDYFIRTAGAVSGPIASAQIKRMIQQCQLGEADEIAISEAGPWRPLGEIPQLAAIMQSESEVASCDVAASRRVAEQVTASTVTPPPVVPPPPVNPAVKSSLGSTDASGPVIQPQVETFGRVAMQLAGRGRRLLDGAIAVGRQRVYQAYSEAISSVAETETLLLSDKIVFGRGCKDVDKVLPHPQVSLRHAVVERTNKGIWIQDIDSRGGTFVEGQRIKQPTLLKPGDVITIGPYSMTFDGTNLISKSAINNATLICRNLCKLVTDPATNEEFMILNNVNLVALPREFLVVLGPSGSGKSTLLNALAARSLATSGDVTLNGRNLYANFESLKKNIALVPQQDILHDNLRLGNALFYTARLRLSPDLKADEICDLTNAYLAEVDLLDRSDTYIHSLSGGQIKRASIVNEIISQPSLLFVDEATSGLDEQTDGEIMQIFRKIAEEGKTVVCITHNLTNVQKHCHKVAIMAPGGFLAFVGTPQDALEYFQIGSLGDIYRRLGEMPGRQWRDRFEQTATFKDMRSLIDDLLGRERPSISRLEEPSRLQQIGSYARHTSILFRRGTDLLRADTKSLAMLVGQCVFVAGLIVLLFGDASSQGHFTTMQSQTETTAILFLLSVSSFWFGCNNAAKEIVKEKTIHHRERSVGLNLYSYLTAKFLLLATLTFGQVAGLYLIVAGATALPGNSVVYVASFLLSGCCGISLGLMISAFATTADEATTAVPIAVIPQVILAGMIAPVSGLAKLLACLFVPCYWAFGAALAGMPEDFAPRQPSLAESSYWLSMFVVLIQSASCIAVAIVCLRRQYTGWIPPKAELDAWMKATATLVARGTRTLRLQAERRTAVSGDAGDIGTPRFVQLSEATRGPDDQREI